MAVIISKNVCPQTNWYMYDSSVATRAHHAPQSSSQSSGQSRFVHQTILGLQSKSTMFVLNNNSCKLGHNHLHLICAWLQDLQQIQHPRIPSNDTSGSSTSPTDTSTGSTTKGTSTRWYTRVRGQHLCKSPSCNTRASFDMEGELQARYCTAHKQPGMVDVVSLRCEFNRCLKRPVYNVAGAPRARFCMSHQLPDMVNVVSPRCEQDGCLTIPSYGVDGSKKGIFCAAHKLPGMVDVTSVRCKSFGCTKRASYNIRGARKALFCSCHRLKAMVNVKTKVCEHVDCLVQPSFGVLGSPSRRFCANHRKQGMVRVRWWPAGLDVFEGCQSIQSQEHQSLQTLPRITTTDRSAFSSKKGNERMWSHSQMNVAYRFIMTGALLPDIRQQRHE